MAKKTDVTVNDGGSVFLVTPESKKAQEWVKEHISEDATRLGNSIAVEHRYICDLVTGMRKDGLAVSRC